MGPNSFGTDLAGVIPDESRALVVAVPLSVRDTFAERGRQGLRCVSHITLKQQSIQFAVEVCTMRRVVTRSAKSIGSGDQWRRIVRRRR